MHSGAKEAALASYSQCDYLGKRIIIKDRTVMACGDLCGKAFDRVNRDSYFGRIWKRMVLDRG